MKKITIKINSQSFLVSQDKTILAIALENSIDIPYLCWHPDIDPRAN